MRWKRSLFMSMKNQAYNSMCEEENDSKIPLHNDQAFQRGIEFQIKFIGSLEVPKPSSRGEIVAAMRRIRHEFKARAVKKRSVNLSISVDGVQVSSWKKNKKTRYAEHDRTVLMQHPVCRVFYVSHDSQDLKIFSYIARDSTTNVFRCNVFKAYKKNEAIHIVRTIGQAFEVCHKLSLQENSTEPVEKPERYLQSVQHPVTSVNDETNFLQTPSSSEFTLKHQMQFMQEQLQQMQNESEVAFNQIKLLKEQFNLEMVARMDAQNKNKQLIDRNRELLTHIQQLLIYSHELEVKLNQNIEPNLRPSLFVSSKVPAQPDCASDSPDSGKGKEISSDNLSSLHDQQVTTPCNHSIIPDDLTSHTISINATISKTIDYEGYLSTSTSCSSINKHPIEHYLYDHIIPTESSFANSAFTESPLRTITK